MQQPWKFLSLVVILLLLWAFKSSAQSDTLECNVQAPLILPDFEVSETHSDEGNSFWQNGGHVPANVIDADLTNYARAHIKQTGSATLRVSLSDTSIVYDSGVYAGFLIKSPAFTDGAHDAVTISTFLNGNLRESFSGVELMGEIAEGNNVPIDIGFLTGLSFNQIEVRFDTSQGMSHFDVFYAVVQGFCQGEVPDCNTSTTLNTPGYPAVINYLLTGADSASVGKVLNAEAAITVNTTDFAKLIHHPNVTGNLYISIKEQMNGFNTGSFVGFDMENNNLSWMDFIDRISITTYADGILQESYTGEELVFGVNTNSSLNRQTVGLVISTPADEIRLSVHQESGADLGMTKIFGAIFQVLCPGELFDCNTLTGVVSPTHPVVIDASHTGVSGQICGSCDVINPGNMIDGDLTNFTRIVIGAGVTTIASVAIENIINDFDAGFFAGFHIENAAHIGTNILSGVSVSTYLDGVLKETHTGAGALISLGHHDLLNEGEQIIGFVAGQPFDMVKLTLSNSGFFNIGSTQVFGLVVDSLCTLPLLCDTTAWLVNPDYPVMIDESLTGINGVACLACAVENEMNVISADPSDFASITITAGIAATGSIGVVDGLNTYPAGTIAGFAIEDVNNLIQANLFNSLTISTYNNGVFAESFTGSELLNASVHLNWIPPGEGIYNVGIMATMPFDAIQLTVGSLAGINNNLNVYGVFVNTDLSIGEGLECDACNEVVLKVLLEGPYDSTTLLMNTILNEYHLLPGQDPSLSTNEGAQAFGVAAPAGQPYNTSPWNWAGREGDDYGDDATDIPYDEEVVDWMLISVRAGDSLASSEVWKCAGLLYSDGTIIFPEDCACVSMLVPDSFYYVVIEHRNHLPVMSPRIQMEGNELTYDFTSDQAWIHEIGGMPVGSGQKTVAGRYMMYAANSYQENARGDINASDDAQWLIENGTIFQYKSGDHNMDGDVNATDEFIWLINNSNFTLIPF